MTVVPGAMGCTTPYASTTATASLLDVKSTKRESLKVAVLGVKITLIV